VNSVLVGGVLISTLSLEATISVFGPVMQTE